MHNEREPKRATHATTATTGGGLRVAALCWVVALLFFAGGYITILVSYLLPVVALVGAILSLFDLVKGRKWALLGLVLSIAPLLLAMGFIALMIGGS